MKSTIAIVVSLMLTAAITSFAQSNQTHMKEDQNYSVEIIRYSIPEENAKIFEAAYEKAGTHLKDSEYCLGFHILHGEDEPEHYIVTIYWTSKDDHLGKFRQSSQFTEFLKHVRPFYNNIEEMKHYNKTANSWMREQ